MTLDRSRRFVDEVRGSLRRVARIARWEATGGASLDRRGLALAALAILALLALAYPVATSATAPDEGIYRVGVEPSSPYYEPVAISTSFAVVDREPPFEVGLDLTIHGERIAYADTPNGRAAAGELGDAIERYNDRLMRDEPDEVAAFPVSVQLLFVERDVSIVRTAGGSDERGSTGADGGTDSGDTGEDVDGADGADNEAAVDTADGRSNGESRTSERTVSADERDGEGSSLGIGSLVGRTAGTPSDISPPFPFVSLVLAFAFVVPMNFVVQVYASSVLRERTNRRGEPMLVAPVSSNEIVAGKTLPYLVAAIAITGIVALGVRAGPLALAAVIPVALLFLACGFIGAMLARSHKELTFVLVTVSVVVTTFVFVPAIFADVHPIAAISPLSIVVWELEGTAVTTGTFVFSTAPATVSASVLFAVGTGMYREEDLFAQRSIPAKLLDALANPIRGRRSAALASALSIPFVFLAELLAVAVLFVLPLSLSLPLLLVAVATIEEIAKSVHVYAGFRRGRYDRALGTAAIVGAFSGAGFFVGEKAAAIAQIVGLDELDLGRAAFEVGAGVGGGSGPILLALLLAPLALHAVTAVISSVGARHGRGPYAAALVIAIGIHAAYNFGVVTALG